MAAMVNQAMAYARMGENQKADEALQKALKEAPDNAAANVNMGLLKAGENDLVVAEKHLRAALKADPKMAQAAYNLCVILSKDRLDEAVDICRKAAEVRPDVPRYAFTLAFYRQQKGDLPGAANVLDRLIARYPAYAEAYVLLGGIYEKQGKKAEAEEVYIKGIALEGMLFTPFYARVSCTPGRAAVQTGRIPNRSGMTTVAFPGQAEPASGRVDARLGAEEGQLQDLFHRQVASGRVRLRAAERVGL